MGIEWMRRDGVCGPSRVSGFGDALLVLFIDWSWIVKLLSRWRVKEDGTKLSVSKFCEINVTKVFRLGFLWSLTCTARGVESNGVKTQVWVRVCLVNS